ncbi:MAG: hypothetical protein UU43_C0007G0003 [Candidatus Falkowbacteria bacterium GW2011_GWA2_41_14]|uniref:Uncharacterized protein n=1 Tax=Candidatus Falkowbacteria bacterium GW2011_GWA2_41_14 TaxID=1618635 RepID=A0A0G0URK1_9BACT|nr:MAG: hypothetical protein UU43_C0007G0003 [Candidatus Falkowbacteria bacterium GW2011_GWA2_41_14]
MQNFLSLRAVLVLKAARQSLARKKNKYSVNALIDKLNPVLKRFRL